MPTQNSKRKKSIEQWNQFVDNFKLTNEDYTEYANHNKAAENLMVQGKYLEAFVSYEKAETSLRECLETFEANDTAFQKRSKKFDTDKKTAVEAVANKMQRLKSNLQNETIMVSSRKEIAGKNISPDQLQQIQSEHSSVGSSGSSHGSSSAFTQSNSTDQAAGTNYKNPLFQSSDMISSMPVISASNSNVSNAAAEVKPSQQQPLLDPWGQEWLEYFSNFLTHDDYKAVFENIREGNRLYAEGNYPDAIKNYQRALKTLDVFAHALAQPTPLQPMPSMDRLHVNAKQAEVLNTVLTTINSVEKQLAEAQRPQLTEEQTHGLVEQALVQRKTVLSDADQARLLKELTDSTPSVNPQTPTSEARHTTANSTPSKPPLEIPQPIRHTTSFLSGFSVLESKNLPTSVLGSRAGDSASGQTDEHHTEDDLDKLLRQVDQELEQERTASRRSIEPTNATSSDEQMLKEMGGNDPVQIEESSWNSKIGSFYEEDENYQIYQRDYDLSQAAVKKGDPESAAQSMDMANRHLQFCAETLKVYETEFQRQAANSPELKKSSIPSDIEHLKKNIAGLLEITSSYKEMMSDEAKEAKSKQQELNTSKPNESQRSVSKDPEKGSSGPGSGSGLAR
jgi:tetratricopeptide (TPR) repeat protein